MFQALHKIELSSANLSSEAMIAVGIILTGAGLFVWLGGLRWHFVSALLNGVFAGLVTSSFTPGEYQFRAFSIAAVAAALLAAAFRKRSLVFAGALIVVFSGLFLSALPELNASSELNIPALPQRAEGVEKFTPAQTISILTDHLFFVTGLTGTQIRQLPAGAIIGSSVAGLCMAAAGIFLARIVSAVGCSMLGTIFVFAGMIVLLLQKGSMPFSGIYQRPLFFQTIIICMVIFGSASGLLLCPIKRRKPDREKMKTEKKNELH